ncbi:putative secondary metabolism biosynthetic enzyme [Penicillium ochrochloron]
MSESKIVLITGANSGVGYATAETIVSQPGYHVILACRDIAKANQARSELEATNIKGTLSVLQLDVENDTSISKAVNLVSEQFGRVDIFISNAGTTSPGSTGRDRLQKIFSTNVFGAMLVSEAFIPLLLQSSRPYLIQISSALGSIGLATDPSSEHSLPPWDEYRMSKAALNMMTIQMNKRLKNQNVRVFAFCPGLVRSKLRGDSEAAVTAQGHAGDPMDSAKAILEIVSGQRDEDVGKFVWIGGCYPW